MFPRRKKEAEMPAVEFSKKEEGARILTKFSEKEKEIGEIADAGERLFKLQELGATIKTEINRKKDFYNVKADEHPRFTKTQKVAVVLGAGIMASPVIAVTVAGASSTDHSSGWPWQWRSMARPSRSISAGRSRPGVPPPQKAVAARRGSCVESAGDEPVESVEWVQFTSAVSASTPSRYRRTASPFGTVW